MMIAKVCGIRHAHSGFGQWQRDEECEVGGEWESVEEYADHVARENKCTYAIDPNIAEMGDEDGEQLAEALRSADGNVLGGHDTLVSYHFGVNGCGEPDIRLESVRLVDGIRESLAIEQEAEELLDIPNPLEDAKEPEFCEE